MDAGLFASGRTTMLVREVRFLERGGFRYLYASVLRSEIERLMVGGVGDAKDVARIVGGPQGIQAAEA